MQTDYEKIINFISTREDLPIDLKHSLNEWLLEHQNDPDVISEMHKIWEEEVISYEGRYNPNELTRILEEVSEIETNADGVAYSPEIKKTKRVAWLRYAAVVAAIVLSVVSTVVMTDYLRPQPIVLATAEGSRGDFTLPDGTVVKLNGASRLCYDSKGFGIKGKRKVSVEGEVYFDVAKDKKHPFVVDLNGSRVEVTGTTFEVRNYPFLNYEEVVLETGSVNISEIGGDRNISLNPDHRFVAQRNNGDWRVEDANAETYCRWTQRRLKLENEPLGDFLITIERKYGVELNIAPDVDLNKTLTITIQNDELEEILSIVRYLTGIDYELSGHTLKIK